MKRFDRVFSCLLILGGVSHAVSSYRAYRSQPELLLWSLFATLFLFLLAAVNFLRAGRPGDFALSWIAVAANLCLFGVCLEFGSLIGNMADARVVLFSIVTLVLMATSLHTMVQGRRAARFRVL